VRAATPDLSIEPASPAATDPGTRAGTRHHLPVALVRLLLAVTTVAAVVLGTATAASAHAVVVSSDPSADARLPSAPAAVTIQFNEPVTTDLGGLTVLDQDGKRVDNSDSNQPTSSSLTTSLRSGLGDGTYVANYKVISADGHPVSGSVVFGVGNGPIGNVSNLTAANDSTMDVVSKVGQFVTYAGVLTAAGLAFFAAFLFDQGPEGRQLSRIARAAVVVGIVGMALTLIGQAGLATGQGWTAVFDWPTFRATLREGLGWQDLGLLVGLAMCWMAVRARRLAVAQSLALYGGLIATSSFVLWGHASQSPNPWIAMAADVVHVAVAAAWLGGLVGMATVLASRSRVVRAAVMTDPDTVVVTAGSGGAGDVASSARRGTADPMALAGAVAVLEPTARSGSGGAGDAAVATGPEGEGAADEAAIDDQRLEVSPFGDGPGSFVSTVALVRRFSSAAAISVIALIAAGLVLAWQEVGSLDALTSTTYGQLLLLKVGAVGVVLFVAAYNRFLLLRWLLDDEVDDGQVTGASVTGASVDDAPVAVGTADVDPEPEPEPEPDFDEREELLSGWRTLLRTIRIEALVIVVVLGITAVLVNSTPGTAAQVAGPFQQSQAFQGGKVDLTITPNHPGVNSFHLDMSGPNGLPADLGKQVTLELSLPAKGIGPIQREMIKGGTGHFLLENVSDMAIAGDWTVVLAIRVTDFDEERVTFQDTVQ
jgi:copper transport protein